MRPFGCARVAGAVASLVAVTASTEVHASGVVDVTEGVVVPPGRAAYSERLGGHDVGAFERLLVQPSRQVK